MRLFIAIELSGEARQHLLAVQDELRPLARGVAFTPADNIHLTLKFLGEVPDARLALLCEALASTPPTGDFDLQCDHLLCLPPRGPVRILGAGLNETPAALTALQDRIEAACAELGYPRETRAFLPHLTLGRARQPLHPARRAPLLDTAALRFPGPRWSVQSCVLVESRLLPRGPQYTPLSRFYISLL